MIKIKLIFLYKLLLIFLLNVWGSPLEIKHNTNYNEFSNNELYKENLKSKVQPSHQYSKLKSYMDQTADPCEDFHQYACGNWEKQIEIPIDYATYDFLAILKDKLKNDLSEILNENQKKVQNIREIRKFDMEEQVNIIYSSCMDLETINKRGSEPIIKFLTEIGGFPLLDGNKWSSDNYRLEDALAFQALYQFKSFFYTDIDYDFKGSKNNIIYLFHPDLGLVNFADYLEIHNKPHLNGYRDFISDVFELLSAPKELIPTVIDEIIDLETKLARLVDSREYGIEESYAAETISTLKQKYPEFNWTEYIQKIYNINLNDDVKIVIYGAPKNDQIFNLLINTDKRIIANYLSWRATQQMINFLDERFIAARNKFTKVLTGSDKSKRERDVICSKRVSKSVGMAVSALYVKKFFNAKSKDDVSKMTQSIIKVFRDNLQTYDWIGPETKSLAEIKVNKTVLAVGYPDFIVNKVELNKYYEGINFKFGQYFENYLNILRFQIRKQQQKFGKRIDKLEWPTIPAEVNAFFEQPKNRILFPAAVLQPPVYHADFPKSLNFGAIGYFIGHELTHGFDTNGRSFDRDGNIKFWWDDKSSEEFNNRTQCFIDQYSKYKIYNKTLNGDLTKTENIADNGGIRLSYKVYTDWLSGANEEEKKNEVIPGLNLSPEQLFFVSFAQTWCEYIRPEAIVSRLEIDEHPPGILRTLGTLQNFKEFSNAYQCPPNSTMNPAKKCKLW